MSLMIDGQLRTDWMSHETKHGEFVRKDSQFRNWITADGSAGPSGEGGFAAAPGRYHLYVSHACPWAHRTLIVRSLKGLDDVVSVSVVHPYMGPEGWSFATDFPDATGDTLYGAAFMHEIYTRAEPHYSGIVTVPVLWDRERETIVNNESSEIIRMLNSAFDAWGRADLDLYPEALRADIDRLNAEVYDNVNNGVYRAGFADTQTAHAGAVTRLFATLNKLEERLAAGGPYLFGATPNEADWRLFTTLVRFDAVYHEHFKCNLCRLIDYPQLRAYARRLYETPGVAATVHFDHIKHHYYTSHPELNPRGLVPLGPAEDFTCVD
ncbi:glutathione S-transferase family protein [Acidihalobacter ferrooxydans]|uniref:Glutathione-dependent reductase n=1 Tax=Acidihalobacter ferrooxydans TaxID=1765967 RepID=A0A1P8UDP1_9GAMM|nr:glutathione S-transferase family protein [Acidihalobacter ferrooxydans]APZ41981.1 glutathione-dependent reductase [Acidihalobacter ferrooxydans]